ncbi:uncharacterized protein TNCV_4894171 [Trichonephila clavipes]|nr:uncharacterized protein TNCV_4894171 [Trichonephila clavipes]
MIGRVSCGPMNLIFNYTSRNPIYIDITLQVCVAGIVPRWFKEHSRNFTLLSCPAQSHDINPIENVWDKIERGIWQLDPVPSDLKALEKAIHDLWSENPHTTHQQLTEFPPKRFHAALRPKEGPILYY